MHENRNEIGCADRQQCRIDWIDFAKGLTIMLVVIGHSVHGALRGAIFSFHMPLFFILSSLTYRSSSDVSEFKQKTKKAYVHLVIPALVLFGLGTVIEILEMVLTGTYPDCRDYVLGKLLTILFASGARFFIGEMEITRLGIPWILIALFFGRTLFDWIHLRVKGKVLSVGCIFLTVVGIAIGQKWWLPMSLDIALASVFFLLWGQWMKNADVQRRPALQMLIAMLIWAVTLLIMKCLTNTYLEMAMRRYPLFPLCYVTAITGTWLISAFSVLVTRYAGALTKPILFCGKNSLLLCVHTVDYLWEQAYTAFGGREIVSGVIRLVLDFFIFAVAANFWNWWKRRTKVEEGR